MLFVGHTSVIGGGERALVDLLQRLPGNVHPSVACPPGPFAAWVEQLGLSVVPIRGTAGSFRVHAVHTPRTVRDILRDGLNLRRIAERLDIDVIHGNSTRAGLMAVASSDFGGPPSIVHVRDCMPDGRIPSIVRRYLANRADAVLGVSWHALNPLLQSREPAYSRVVYGGVDSARFDPETISRRDARERLGVADGVPLLAIIGQVSPPKGQEEAIRTVELVRREHPDAQLLVVGESKFVESAARFDNQDYERSLVRLVSDRGLEGSVRFLGERDDVVEILAAVDVLVAPSWHEGFGRAITEAMAMEVPVVATVVGGPSEVIEDGVDGLLRPPRTPGLWAQAVASLLASGDRREQMGRKARRKVSERFTHERTVAGVVKAYGDVLGRGPGREQVGPPASR